MHPAEHDRDEFVATTARSVLVSCTLPLDTRIFFQACAVLGVLLFGVERSVKA